MIAEGKFQGEMLFGCFGVPSNLVDRGIIHNLAGWKGNVRLQAVWFYRNGGVDSRPAPKRGAGFPPT